MHPWEDWAESWAHYLHMLDTLETAKSHGLTVRVPGQPAERSRRPRSRSATSTSGVRWHAVALALNSLTRSMGVKDVYPFVLSSPVLQKLAFIHRVIAGRAAETNAPALTRRPVSLHLKNAYEADHVIMTRPVSASTPAMKRSRRGHDVAEAHGGVGHRREIDEFRQRRRLQPRDTAEPRVASQDSSPRRTTISAKWANNTAPMRIRTRGRRRRLNAGKYRSRTEYLVMQHGAHADDDNRVDDEPVVATADIGHASMCGRGQRGNGVSAGVAPSGSGVRAVFSSSEIIV